MFPVIGLISAVAAALGLYGLYWYDSLDKEERERADRLAVDYAKRLYNKGLKELTSSQFDHVMAYVRNHLGL